jgi:hypothetical protein
MSVDVFEREFAIESLKSERLRVTILMGAIISSVTLLLLMTLLFFAQFDNTFRGNARPFLLAALVLFAVNLSYLLAERIVLGRLIKKQMRPFPALKYLSAFVETSIPTAGIIIGSFFLGPLYTLFTLISEIVWQAVSSAESKVVPMGQVEVRGREQSIQIYQVA